MSTVLFKQWYKTRTDPSTPGLNARHLQYIATRPGAVYNKGCGFGLWGQLPGDGAIRIQTDLERAKRIVREASEKHTLYRALLSVGKRDAERYGLYSRDRWERLVNDHIAEVAKEMDIKPEDLRWCASFHCAKGHPHVHILYWDDSDQPRQEYVPKPLWDAKAERVRAAFAGDIHREEIREAQAARRAEIRPLREAVLAMCREANPEKALDLPRLYNSAALKGLSRQFAELVREMPAGGSLRYAYLPPAYREKVNALVDACLKVPELAKELERYEDRTLQISQLYANGADSEARNWEKAKEKLYKELGNTVMDALREIRDELQCDGGRQSKPEISALLHEAVTSIVPTLGSYRLLRSLLPRDRIPVQCMARQIPGYFAQMNKVIGDVMLDARVRTRLQAYAQKAAGIDPAALPDAPRHRSGTERLLNGKMLTDQQWDAYQAAYREVKRELRHAVEERARQDAGWTEEAARTGAASVLGGMLRLLSQAAGQRQAALSLAQLRRQLSRDRSREARRDEQARDSTRSGWDDNK